ncbi:MAG TPA: hypothetical protein VI750_12440 [Pyrinomonadaceae bacterium]|nr:hypothetical protein [Pyrinomonadaceae bacterium]
MKRLVLAFVFVLISATLAAADTIYLRDGRTVTGTLLGFINGRFAVRVTKPRVNPSGTVTGPRDEFEIVFFRPGEVQRIEIDGRSLDDLRYETRTVDVMLAPNWIDTGVDLRRDERVRVNATGTIVAGRSRITPDGLRSRDATAPLPRAAEGALIGSIGEDSNSPIIELGSSREFVAERDGRLYLTANRGSYTDARGAFTVQIKKDRDLASLENADDNIRERRTPGRFRNRTRGTPDLRRDREPQEINIDVAGTSRATDTNLDVRAGDQLSFTASGRVIAGRRIGEVGPEGARTSGFGAIIGTRPVPTSGAGALIGYIRMTDGQTSQPFLIGSQLTITIQVDGRLYLAINDDDYSDNGGSFNVKISYR